MVRKITGISQFLKRFPSETRHETAIPCEIVAKFLISNISVASCPVTTDFLTSLSTLTGPEDLAATTGPQFRSPEGY